MHEILFQGINPDELVERIGQLIESKIRDFAPYTKTKEQSDYLSRKEVATLLKITLPTLHEWTKLGYLKSYKMGSRVLYKQSEVVETLERIPSFKYKKGGMSHE